LAQCRFPGLAFSNAKILIYFSNKIYGSKQSNLIKQHSETVTKMLIAKFHRVIYCNFRSRYESESHAVAVTSHGARDATVQRGGRRAESLMETDRRACRRPWRRTHLHSDSAAARRPAAAAAAAAPPPPAASRHPAANQRETLNQLLSLIDERRRAYTDRLL